MKHKKLLNTNIEWPKFILFWGGGKKKVEEEEEEKDMESPERKKISNELKHYKFGGNLASSLLTT